MEEREDLKAGIFNLTKDTVTVKKVAEICKKYNPKIMLRETNDEIPNLGFSLSNKKIKKLGFKFLYNLEENIKEMKNDNDTQIRLKLTEKDGQELERVFNLPNDSSDSSLQANFFNNRLYLRW